MYVLILLFVYIKVTIAVKYGPGTSDNNNANLSQHAANNNQISNLNSKNNCLRHRCGKFEKWNAISSTWSNLVGENDFIICQKDYGGDGNCLYCSISGLLMDGGYTKDDFKHNGGNLPYGMNLSMNKVLNQGENIFTFEELRVLASIYFVGANPYDENAESYIDINSLADKLEVLSGLVGTDGFYDITWNPKSRLNQLNNADDKMSVIKGIYDDISNSINVKTWGSYNDIQALSDMLLLDVFILSSDSATAYRVTNKNKLKPICTILLYYKFGAHFNGAAIIYSNNPNVLNVVNEEDNIPEQIKSYATLLN